MIRKYSSYQFPNGPSKHNYSIMYKVLCDISFYVCAWLSYCSDVLAQIDHGEFEGFEYVNPLLMSKVDDV